MGLVTEDYFQDLKATLEVWYQPYEKKLKELPVETVLSAIKLDKKNTKQGLHCILTRGAGRMEKIKLGAELDLGKLIAQSMEAIQSGNKIHES
jgi:3-dehydroquinate synthase